MPGGESIPRFGLYGERAARPGEPDFLHIETIWARSHLNDWTIRPHRHDCLLQLLLVSGGGGVLTIDADRVPFAAPWLVALPPTVVHGFAFRPGTEGHVLTVSEDFFFVACAPDAGLSTALGRPLALDLAGAAEAAEIAAAFARIAEEFAADRPRRTAALAALLKWLAVLVDRARATRPAGDAVARPSAYLRFRHLVEERWREERAVAAYAAALGLTPARLNALCRQASGRTAGRILRERVLVEAKRQLAYTGLGVAEIAYELGFAEPGYFTRAFRKATGETPQQFRAGRAQRG